LARDDLVLRPFDGIEPLELYRRLRSRTSHSFILEGMTGPRRQGAYTYIGFDPAMRFVLQDGTMFIDGKQWDHLWPSP
jgi:anthranilate/para-aminobenzoate synthase component I